VRTARRALVTVARSAADTGSLVVAHGASLRGTLPGRAAAQDQGTDLPTGRVATLKVQLGAGRHASVRLQSWPGAAPG
jgi:hypothetical protein